MHVNEIASGSTNEEQSKNFFEMIKTIGLIVTAFKCEKIPHKGHKEAMSRAILPQWTVFANMKLLL